MGPGPLFAVLNAAMADGYIGSFFTKYLDPETKLFWRPVTAIREADHDGNRPPTATPDWKPLRDHPADPGLRLGACHRGRRGRRRADGVLRQRTRFAACSVSEPATNNSCVDPGNTGPKLIRHYWSFTQAANENALSRIYVGFHFRKAAMDGNRHGLLIGAHAVATKMRPLGW